MSAQQKFHRAYKACNKCRMRKTRCNITAEEYSAGLPCARCRREMKECTFPDERQVNLPKPRRSQRRANIEANSDKDPYDQSTDVGVSKDSCFVEVDNSRTQERPAESQQEIQYQRYFASESPHIPRTTTIIDNNVTAELSVSNNEPEKLSLPSLISDGDPMLRTVISNGQDALNLLFAATQQGSNTGDSRKEYSPGDNMGRFDQTTPQGSVAAATSTSPGQSTLYGANPSPCVMSTNISRDVLETWKAYRFVTTGWLSAEEAVTYVDLFFQNMARLSPILDDFYSKHENHYFLVVREPMLCCVILTISTRYHVLPVPGGESRGFLNHQRLWEHCQHLLMRIMLGQEKGSKAKTRTLGSVEALLLLTEWQPRGLHMPPGSDGWDSDALFTLRTGKDENEPEVDSSPRGIWLHDVLDPSRRFDRMSWMILGAAMTLANELSVFDNERAAENVYTGTHDYEGRKRYRSLSLASLLHTQQEQLSSRLGRRSLVPQNTSFARRLSGGSHQTADAKYRLWESFMLAWSELTKLTRSMCDMLFPSNLVTSHLLQTGRYADLIEHCVELLSIWEKKHLQRSITTSHFYDILFVEYNHARVFANSLGLQAIVDRSFTESNSGVFGLSAADYNFVSAVVDGCLEILEMVTKLQQSGCLRFAPVSMFLRITSASVFLLKGLGIGVNKTKLQEALSTLTRAITALKASKPDDLHLGARYAALLETHVLRLQEKFVPAEKPHVLSSRPLSIERRVQSQTETQGVNWDHPHPRNVFSGSETLNFESEIGCMDDSWLTLPFDPSLVPFVADDSHGFQGLGDDSLNFIWNLEPQQF